MDVIASYRAMAYLNHFNKFGLQPTLLTHHWGKTARCKEITTEALSHGTVIRIPIQKYETNYWLSRIEKIPFLNKVSIMIRWLSGNLDPTASDWNSYKSLKLFCLEHLKRNRYDVLVGIFFPTPSFTVML